MSSSTDELRGDERLPVALRELEGLSQRGMVVERRPRVDRRREDGREHHSWQRVEARARRLRQGRRFTSRQAGIRRECIAKAQYGRSRAVAVFGCLRWARRSRSELCHV